MGKTITFRVVNNRMQFRCSACGAKRNITVPPKLRRKNMRCHKCDKITKCVLNRRLRPRELHSGKIYLSTIEGKEIEVNLYDISATGIGMDIPIGAARSRLLKIGTQVRLRCTWNPHLLGRSRYEVKNIQERRVGVKKMG